MNQPDLPARLARLGPPIFVTDDDAWRVAGIESTSGREDGALVFARNGALALRTECLTREAQPAWANVKNTQMSSVHRPDATAVDWDAVVVDEAETTLVVDGVALLVPLLRSRQTSSRTLTEEIGHCTLEVAGRRLVVGGHLGEFIGLRVKTLYDLDTARF